MAFELREGQMLLSRNKQKNQDRQPDFRGTAMINGAEHEIAMWTKENDKGRYLLGSIKPKGQRASASSNEEPF